MSHVIIGIFYGITIGALNHWFLFRRIQRNRAEQKELLEGIGTVFLLRYVLDALLLMLFAFVTRHAGGITAAAISITVAVKISLLIAYTRKGGKIE